MPSQNSDPKAGFFTGAGNGPFYAANCYAYALNLPVGPLNPGRIAGEPEAVYAAPLENYIHAAEYDGLLWLSADPDKYADKKQPITGEIHQGYVVKQDDYLVAFKQSKYDQHWLRINSNLQWTEKLPKGMACVCDRNPELPHPVFAFRGWFLVRYEIVQEKAKKWTNRSWFNCLGGRSFLICIPSATP